MRFFLFLARVALVLLAAGALAYAAFVLFVLTQTLKGANHGSAPHAA